MPANKNQHYVPRFYQRYFSDDGKFVGVFNIAAQKYIADAPIKSQMSGDYFYAKDNAAEVEEKLSNVETICKNVLDTIAFGPICKFSEEQLATLQCYISFQYARTRKLAETQAELEEKHFNQLIDFCAKSNGIDIGNYKFKVKPQPLKTLATTLEVLCKYTSDLKYKIIVSQVGSSFISCDNPVCLYNQYFQRLGVNLQGFGLAGLQLFLPITPSRCVLLYDATVYKIGNRKQIDIQATKDDVFQINRLMMVNAMSMILFNSKDIKEIDCKCIYDSISSYRRDENVEEIPFDGVNSSDLFGSQNTFQNINLRLSFIKELDKSKAIRCFKELGLNMYRKPYHEELLNRPPSKPVSLQWLVDVLKQTFGH